MMGSRLVVYSLLAVALPFVSIGLAAEQDYAARFKELRDQKADAQIEPLLNEWRDKRPNDAEAWITSANYYFNQGQVMISTKKPQKGDFSLTDKKTGKQAGSISFDADKGAIKRAAELYRKRLLNFRPARISGAGSHSFTRRLEISIPNWPRSKHGWLRPRTSGGTQRGEGEPIQIGR